MKPAEAATVLFVAGVFDPRLAPPTVGEADVRAAAWSAALDSDMPVEWAREAVTKHYSESSTAIMPAALNTAWRTERRVRAEKARAEQQKRELEEAEAAAVPMPDELRAKIVNLRTKWNAE